MREWLFGKCEIVAKVVEFKPEIDPNADHEPEEYESVDRTGKKEMLKSEAVIPSNYRVDLMANGKKLVTLAWWGEKKGVRVASIFARGLQERRKESAEEYLKRLKPIETQR